MPELFADGESNFELDHFRPRFAFPALASDFANLYYACHVCNHNKRDHWPDSALEARGIGFVDLCASEVDEHYRLASDGSWLTLTESAAYTVAIVRLNSAHLLTIRSLLAQLAVEGGGFGEEAASAVAAGPSAA